MSSENGMNWGSIFSGAAAGAPLGPLGMLGGAAITGIGGWLQQNAENARYEKERAYLKEQDKIKQKNTERQLGMNGLSFMKDNFQKALARSLRGGM